MPKLKPKNIKKSKSPEEVREEEKFEAEYTALSNDQKVVLELVRLRNHFKKNEKFDDHEVYPPLLYTVLRMYLEANVDLEKARLKAIQFLREAVETELDARKYVQRTCPTTAGEKLADMVKSKTTSIH